MTDKINTNRQTRTITLLASVFVLAVTAAAPAAHAQVFKALYAFKGGADGGAPWGPPLLDSGNIFGTTYSGGGPSSAQVGTVFEYNPPSGLETYYYIFAGQPTDGAYPVGGLVTDGFGDYFGTTTQGGFGLHGTIFEIYGGSEFVLYNFNGHDGENPQGNLIIDPVGNLYGTTSGGGANGSGTAFAFSAGGSLIRLYSFGNFKGDGIGPAANLYLSKGVLYGTTTEGGDNGWGTVFSLNVRAKTETIMYSFDGKRNGGTPTGGLVPDGNGNLYGTTSVGGTSGRGNRGEGVIFKLNIKSKRYTVVHDFTGDDGAQPSGALVTDGQGNFFGTTLAGGTYGYGTVFQFDTSGTLTTLYNFSNGTDGSYPYGGVTLDSSGNLYGTATRGGQYGWGTLFEITPAP